MKEILKLARSSSPLDALAAGETFTGNAKPDSKNIEHARVLEFLARFYLKSGEIEMASKRISTAKSIATKNQFHKVLPRILQLESAVANITGDYDLGIESASQAIELLSEKNPFRGVCLNERATNYSENNEFDKAADDFSEALKIATKAKDKKLEATVRVNLAILMGRHQQFGKSIELLEQALGIAKSIGDRRIETTILLHLGNDFMSKWANEGVILESDKVAIVKGYFERALEIADERRYLDVAAECHLGLGDLASDLGNNEEARKHFDLSLASFQRLKDPKGILGVTTRMFALTARSKTDVSQESINKLSVDLNDALERRDFQNAILVIDQLIEIRVDENNLSEQTKLLVQKNEIQKNLFDTEAKSAIEKGSTALAVAEKERELEQTLNKIQIGELELQLEQRNSSIILAVAIGGVLTSIVLIVLWRTKHAMNLELKNANATIRQEEQKTLLMERHLAKQEKLESLSTMSAGVMHDFNNYLSAIIADAEIGIKNDEEEHKNDQFQTVITTAMCASDLTKGLSNYLGSGELTYDKINIYELLSNLESVLQSFAHSNLQIDFEHDVANTVLFIDQNAIRNVIVNVVKNAVEAKADDTELQILIEVANVELDGQPFCELAITDNGKGMSPKVLERATDPFFSTKSVGRGLGLASCNGIIESHDGLFSIHSKEGWGTEVKIQLPVDCVDSVEEEVEDDEDCDTVRLKPKPETRKRILYVDDDQLVRRAMSSLLSANYDTVVVSSAKEALLELTEADYRFDCVVTDYSLPDENGLELAKTIKQNAPNCATILVSGFVEMEFEESTDIDVFLSKPFTHAALLSNLSDLLADSHGNSEDGVSGSHQNKKPA